jgi:hypothetical protein
MDKRAIKQIKEMADEFEKVASGKEKPRGEFIFPKTHASVSDGSDHFPINTEGRARSALSRANQFDKSPPWYKGSLQGLINAVSRAVHKKYPGIEISEKSKKPGKG